MRAVARSTSRSPASHTWPRYAAAAPFPSGRQLHCASRCGSKWAVPLDLHTFATPLQIVLRAPPDTFFPAPCPTMTGFQLYSVESFAAAADIRIYSRWGAAGAQGAPEGQPAPGSAGEAVSGRLVASARLEGVAMEFGGAYRCTQQDGAGGGREAGAAAAA